MGSIITLGINKMEIDWGKKKILLKNWEKRIKY